MELIDIGANLSHDSFRHDLPQVLARARAAGVTQMVITGASEIESQAAHDIAALHPGVLFATAGVHPHLAKEWNDDTGTVIRELAKSPVVVAVGEAGLDFNRDFSPRPIQESVFTAQLELAAELGVPVVSLLNLQDVIEYLDLKGAQDNHSPSVLAEIKAYQAEYCELVTDG